MARLARDPARRSLPFKQPHPTSAMTTFRRGSRARRGRVFSSSEHSETRARAPRRAVRGTEVSFSRRGSGANFFGRALHSVLGRAASFRYHKGALVGSALVSGCRHACDEEACVKWTREQPRHQVRRSSFGGAASSFVPRSGASPATSAVVRALVRRRHGAGPPSSGRWSTAEGRPAGPQALDLASPCEGRFRGARADGTPACSRPPALPNARARAVSGRRRSR